MKIGILGTGNFACAIGYLLDINNVNITFIGRDIEQLKELELYGTNKKYINYKFKNKINTDSIENNLSNYKLLFYCLPTSVINILDNLDKDVFVIFTCKGFNEKFIFQKFTNYSVLSGGSYSSEILKGIPCYITLSSKILDKNNNVKKILESKNCIISLNDKPESIEILGIFKNILAIFCGIINQLNMGKNIEAAFISKVLQNLKNIIDFDDKTIVEPAGIGDLFLSCSSTKSRNYSFGINLVKTRSDEFNKLVEGYNSIINLNKSIDSEIINDLMLILNTLKSNEPTVKINNRILEILYKY